MNNKFKTYCFFSFFLVFILAGCGKVDVQSEYGPGADLSNLKTYSWIELKDKSSEKLRVKNPRIDKWVKATADKVLAQKGYMQVARKDSDFKIAWFGAVETKVKQESIDHFYSSYGYGPVAAEIGDTPKVEDRKVEYREGTILMDIINPQNHKMIWRGSGAAKLIKGMDESEAALYVERLVTQILKELPKVK